MSKRKKRLNILVELHFDFVFVFSITQDPNKDVNYLLRAVPHKFFALSGRTVGKQGEKINWTATIHCEHDF